MTPSPSLLFKENLKEVVQLTEIHQMLTGDRPGRRHKVEVLNKGAILFSCAAFEAFVEDLARRAFDHITLNAPDHHALPKPLLQAIAKALKEDRHDLNVWTLAGDGWRKKLESYKNEIIRSHIGPFNTPKPHNIQELLSKLIALENISTSWEWNRVTVEAAKEKLKTFVELRGALAHGEQPAPVVRKLDVENYIKFLAPLSVRTSNTVRAHCHAITGSYPWRSISWGAVT